MGNAALIRKVYMQCPLCDRTHEVEEKRRIATTIVKNEEISYEERFYFCQNVEEENEFETGTMANENLLNARNAYRVRHNLLTSDQIVKIRENYGLSQVDLARLLGWGEATIARYESKAIQDEAYDMLLCLIRDNPYKALELLNKNGSKFTNAKKDAIKNKIMEKLHSYGKEYLTRQAFEVDYILYREPSASNGYTKLDVDKIEMIVSYFAEKDPHLTESRLRRLLWYADALACMRYRKAITGMVYKREGSGVCPIGHSGFLNLDKINIHEEIKEGCEPVLYVYPSEGVNEAVLSVSDRDILDTVAAKYKGYKSEDIAHDMNQEKVYSETKSGEIIFFKPEDRIRAFS